MIKLILYSRSYCHLCDDMLLTLEHYRKAYEFSIDVVDVDADEALVEQFDELVPVLFGSRENLPSVQLCHYFLDTEKLEQFLSQ